MWKLLTLLGLGMFLTLLIGGQDRGQMRQGLLQADDPAPAVTAAAFDPDKIAPVAEAAPTVDLATYVPVAPPAPAVAEPVAAAPVAEAAAPAPAPEPEALPVRYVTASSINVREGPATTYAVIGRLTRNEAVSLVGEANDGWVRVRVEGDGTEGFVAARLLSDRAP